MRTLLVQCPCSYGVDMPPLGLAYLSGFLKKNKCDVSILDLSIVLYERVGEEHKKYWNSNNGYCWYLTDIFKGLPFITEELYNEFAGKILSSDADIIGFSIQNTSALFTLEILKRMKLKNSSKTIILGGPNCYNESNKDDDFRLPHDLQSLADIIVIGEGEQTLLNVIHQIQNNMPLDGCKGVAIPKEDKWHFTGFAEPLADLDELPFPDFDSYDLRAYMDKSAFPILTSRGCPMKCVFCTDTYFWSPYRYRSAENVIAEITQVHEKYRNTFLSFNDSLMNGNYNNFLTICDMLINKELNVAWGGNFRVPRRSDPELLKKMKNSGCNYLIVGIESASNRILESMHKGFTIEEAKRFIYDCNKAGIDIVANWIVGFPGETEKDFMLTAGFIKKNRNLIKRNTFSTLTINQFSYLARHKEEFGIILDGNHLGLWRSADGLNNIELRNSRMAYLEKLLEKISQDCNVVRQIQNNGVSL